MDIKEEEPAEEEVENKTDDPFESVWVKAETVVVTPDYVGIGDDDPDAKSVRAKNPLSKTKKPYFKTRKCTVCDFTTVYGNSLKYHMLTHTEERPYSCEYCDFTSKFPPILKRHINTLHGNLVMTNVEPEILTCTKCNYTTTIKQNLKGHIRKHKKNKQFKCSECSFETAYRHNFVKHSKTHLQDVYKCDKCLFETKYHGHITRHMEQIHNEVMVASKHICEYCQTTSKEKWKLRRHKERSVMKYSMRCVFCNFETKYKCQMRKHKKLHDNDNAECSFVLAAEVSTVTEDDINKFIQNDPSDTLYRCDKCIFETKYKGHMTRHLETIHYEVVQSGFGCEICSANFTERHKLKQHQTKSLVKKPVKCFECNFESLYKCEMRKHKKQDHGGLNKRFVYRQVTTQKPTETVKQGDGNNTGREETEGNEDAFQLCDKCPFKTLYEAEMAKHSVEVHNLCKLCNHFFTDKWSLNLHIIKSKSEEIIKCSYCDFGSFYICETTIHANSHFTELRSNDAGTDNVLDYYMNDPNLPKTIADAQTKDQTAYRQIDGPSTTQIYEENTERGSADSSQLGHSKFGQYLIDQNCIDWRTIQVIETNDSVNRYKCPLCDFPSKFKACVQRHFQRHHTDSQNRPYKCVNCNFSTKTKDAIALHNKRNPSGPTLNCEICSYTTSFKCAMHSHQKFHYAHKCKICTSIFKQKYELIRHVATKHLGKGMKCHVCDFIALRKDSLAHHMLTHTGVKPFQCSVCDFGTVRRLLLNVHMRKRHGIVEKIGMTTINESKIDSLKVPSTEEPSKSLEPSNTTAPNDDDVMEPVDNDPIHEYSAAGYNDPINEDSACGYNDPINEDSACGFQEDCYQSMDMLNEDAEDVKPDINHIQIDLELELPPGPSHAPTEFLPIQTMETEEENKEDFAEMFACDQCDYTSPIMTKLAAHISRKHDTNKKFKCILCPFRTSQKNLLVRHRELHKKKMAYKCSICLFKTKLKRIILKHLKTAHNKVVKTGHVCSYCKLSTISKLMLTAHLKRSLSNKALVCTMCNFETMYRCQMKKHKFNHLLEERDEKDETLTKPETTMYTKVKVKENDGSDESSDSSEDNTFKCERCPFESLNEKIMLKHFIRAHNGCKRCSRAFSTRCEYEEHIKSSKCEEVVKCFFCDFDSDYKCETCKHMCTHFSSYNGVKEEGNVSIEDKIASIMDSIVTQQKTGEASNEYDANYETNTENMNQDESFTNNIGLQVEENRFGNFLVNPSYIDCRSLKVEKSVETDAYQCPACEFSTKYSTSMQRHIQRSHAMSHHRPYKCIDCGFEAKTKDSIRKHNQRKISRKKLSCKQCNFTASVKCAFVLHKKKHSEITCKVCAKAFIYNKGLISHFAAAHLKIGLKCQYCDFYAPLKETIVDHESSHTGVKALQCSLCDYSVNRKRLLVEHFRRYHGNDNKTMDHKPFQGKHSKVEIKIENLASGEVLSCDLCNYTNTSKSNLASHIKRKHSMTFMCEKCPYTTPYKGALKSHSLIHTKYSLYKCTKCPYETTFKGRVISHLKKIHKLKIEVKDAKLICEFCNLKHRSFYLLKMHEEKERYDKATKCESCDFVAIYKCQMDKHELTHSTVAKNETPSEYREDRLYTEEVITENVLKCRFCHFIGSKRGTVSRHEATHANENPYKCNLCGFSAKKNLLLMVHWKKYHKN